MKYKWYTYKYFMTGEKHKTRGRFVGWTRDGLGVKRAIFKNKRRSWHIPEYCLTVETRAALRAGQEG